MKSKKVCHGGAHLLGFAVLMVINIRNMKSKKEEHCSPARTLQEFLYMNAFFVSVRILWPGYDLSSRSRRTNALASLAPRLASRALTPWWVQRKAKTGESTTVPGLSFWRSTDLFIISCVTPGTVCNPVTKRLILLCVTVCFCLSAQLSASQILRREEDRNGEALLKDNKTMLRAQFPNQRQFAILCSLR